MTRLISVVTAVDPRRADHLAATWASLEAQKLPEGWDFEWLVQCDGTQTAAQDAVLAHLPTANSRVSYAASRKSGPAIARTMTLARARGGLIKTMDADDRLTPEALSRDIEAHSHRGIGWSAARVIDEYPDGTREPHYPWDPPGGRLRNGAAYIQYHKEHRILVHPATLCIKYELLLVLGGWMSLPASEDTGLLMALDACTDGWFVEEAGMIYRRWSTQMSASREHVDTYELDARRTIVKRRAEAISQWISGA